VDAELIQSSGGIYDVTVDGQLIYSKFKTGRHANPGEVMSLLAQQRGG
jgi:selenoprotein W-related protein